MSATHSGKILMAGCGTLGSAIGRALAAEQPVWGLRRSSNEVPAPLHGLQADLTRPETLGPVLQEEFEVVIYCLTPATPDDAGYRDAFVTGLDNLLNQLEQSSRPPRHLFFVSSTGVYHQDDDSWVNEDSPTRPGRFSGQRLLEAEQRLADSPISGTSVRFSGIYGGGRTRFLEKVRSGWQPEVGQSPFTNRIHQEDCVGSLCHLTRRALRGDTLDRLYLASDSEPARLADVVDWIRHQTPCATPRPGGSERRAGSKRCDNSRLLATGYELRYPSFREGYAAMINAAP